MDAVGYLSPSRIRWAVVMADNDFMVSLSTDFCNGERFVAPSSESAPNSPSIAFSTSTTTALQNPGFGIMPSLSAVCIFISFSIACVLLVKYSTKDLAYFIARPISSRKIFCRQTRALPQGANCDPRIIGAQLLWNYKVTSEGIHVTCRVGYNSNDEFGVETVGLKNINKFLAEFLPSCCTPMNFEVYNVSKEVSIDDLTPA